MLPPELCVTTDSQFCRALAGTTVTCKYIYKPSDFVCRQAAGLCDKPDFCSGFGGACTEDLIHPSGYVCRNDTGGGCDVEELCDGEQSCWLQLLRTLRARMCARLHARTQLCC